MKAWTSLTLTALGALAAAWPAAAQAPNIQRPTVSPYLNLARRDVNPAISYYGLVRPEIQFRGAINQLQQRVTTNQESITDLQTGGSALPPTGHPVGFQTQGRYFQNLGGVRPNVARAAAVTPARPPSRSGR